MSTPQRTIDATRLQVEFLEILDHVARTGEVVLVTKHGHPVAKLVPVEAATASLRCSVTFHGDIVEPLDESWDADRPSS